MAEKMAAVGWQGVTLKVPEDWGLAGIPTLGDDKKGHFRVDSPIASAVDVRWDSALGKKPDLMAKGKHFLEELEKTYRKKKIKFSSKIKQDRDAGNSVGFTWSADRQGQGRLVYCEKCDRVTIVQVVLAKEENVSHLAPAMLDSLRDHRDDGWVDWALYGLEFAVPGSYRLQEQKLMSGYLSLAFKDRNKTIVVQRWGLANTFLSADGLKDWYRKDVLPDIKGYRVSVEEGPVSGHSGLVVEGGRSGIKQAAKAIACSFTLHPHPDRYTGYAWHCEESNRLFSVRATHVQGDDVARKVRDHIVCHGK